MDFSNLSLSRGLGVRWRWYEGCLLFVIVLLSAFVFVFITAVFGERQAQALLISASTFTGLCSLLVILVKAKSKGKLDGRKARQVIIASLLVIALFSLLLVLPSKWGTRRDRGAAYVTGTQTRYDARLQPGSELFGNTPDSFPTDELTFTIYDVCLGKVSHKVRRDGPINPRRVQIVNRAACTQHIKDTARALGADIVGVAELESTHMVSHDENGNPVHLTHKFAVVVGEELRYKLAGPSAPFPWADVYSSLPEEIFAEISGLEINTNVAVAPETIKEVEETLRFFKEGGRTAVELARYIRMLGYAARAHYERWSEVQIIPTAVKAGLGELGRNGVLITKEFGPRGSFAVVTTDLPLVPDRPVDLGIRQFCEACDKCARSCPVRAIPSGGPQVVRGVSKWPLDGDKCFSCLVTNPNCMLCIGSCPFNKPDHLVHRLAAALVERHSALANFVLLKLDDILGYGKFHVRNRSRSGTKSTSVGSGVELFPTGERPRNNKVIE